MEAPDSPAISSTITPRGKKAPIPVIPEAISATPNPEPINYNVMPLPHEQKISNALKSQTCCCCNLQVALTIGFVTVILAFFPPDEPFTWISVLLYICAITGIVGVWMGKKDSLTVSKVALYVCICLSILQTGLALHAWYQVRQLHSDSGTVRLFGTLVFLTSSISTLFLAIAVLRMFIVILQCVMICYVNKGIAVLKAVHKQMNNHVVLHTV